jgi:hypothetical protein
MGKRTQGNVLHNLFKYSTALAQEHGEKSTMLLINPDSFCQYRAAKMDKHGRA